MRKVSIAVSVARQSLLKIVTDPTPKNKNHASKIQTLGITLCEKHLWKAVEKSVLSYSTALPSKLVIVLIFCSWIFYCFCLHVKKNQYIYGTKYSL